MHQITALALCQSKETLKTPKDIWGEVITNWNIEKPLEFFSRFQQYIPMSKLQDSRLWNAMVETRAKHLIQEAIGID